MKVIQFPMMQAAFSAVAKAHGVDLGGEYLDYAFSITVMVAGQPTKQIWTRRDDMVAILIEDPT